MERVIEFTPKAHDDLLFFKKTGQIKILKKIRELLESLLKDPYKGIGKPEALKYSLSGTWSRMVYEVIELKIFILSLRGHY